MTGLHTDPMKRSIALLGYLALALGVTPREASAQPDPVTPNPFGTCTGNNALCTVGGTPCAQGTCDPCGQIRYISFEIPPTSAGSNTAIRVRLTSLHHPQNNVFPPPPFGIFEGQYHYLNTIPGAFSRCCNPTANLTSCNTSVTCTSDADCTGLGVYTKCEKNLCPDSPAFSTFFRCARVGCTPEYRDWSDFSGLITYANGHMIVPSSLYDVAHLADSCAGSEESCAEASAEIQVRTERWGNCDCSNNPSEIPSATDLGQIVSKVRDAVAAITKPRAQMREAITNPLGLVNVLDISHSVETLQGYAYPFHFQCDSDCSSSAQCAPGFCYNPTNHDGRCSPALPCITSADCSGLVDGQSHVCSANGFCTLPQRLDPCTGTCHP